MTVACMGGWCMMRESCAYYHVESNVIIERLCHPYSLDAFRRASASLLGEMADFDADRRPRSRGAVAAGMAAPAPGQYAGARRPAAVDPGQPRGEGGLAC